jgi:hypothetical protein
MLMNLLYIRLWIINGGKRSITTLSNILVTFGIRTPISSRNLAYTSDCDAVSIVFAWDQDKQLVFVQTTASVIIFNDNASESFVYNTQ